MKKRSNPANQVNNDHLEGLLALFSPILKISKKKLEAILVHSTNHKVLKPGESFCEQGEVCNQLGILLRGELKAYFDDENGAQRISRFYFLPDNPIVVCLESFNTNVKSFETIEAVSESHLITIDRNTLMELYQTVPELNTLGRHLAEHSYCQAIRKMMTLQTMKAEQRVKEFYNLHKRLFSVFSRQDIASYLGMHRNMLNSIFKKL